MNRRPLGRSDKRDIETVAEGSSPQWHRTVWFGDWERRVVLWLGAGKYVVCTGFFPFLMSCHHNVLDLYFITIPEHFLFLLLTVNLKPGFQTQSVNLKIMKIDYRELKSRKKIFLKHTFLEWSDMNVKLSISNLECADYCMFNYFKQGLGRHQSN